MLLSEARRALNGIRGVNGNDVVGCQRGGGSGRWQQEREQDGPRAKRGRGQVGGRQEARVATTTLAQRRRARLLRLVYVVGVAGIGLVFVGATRASLGTTMMTTLNNVANPSLAASTTPPGEGGGGSASMGDHGTWNQRWLLTTSDGGEQLETQEEVATDPACDDNTFSGGGAGTVVLLVMAILFTFNGLAIVCDEFFQASLEKISDVRVAGSYSMHHSKYISCVRVQNIHTWYHSYIV